MKKFKIFILLGIIIICLFILTGCVETKINAIEKSNTTEKGRFEKISDEYTFDIYVDTKTNIEYAVSTGAYNYGTVTLLVDADGKPLLQNQ